jgi:hypothetical protein
VYHLYCDLQNSFEIELPSAFLKKVLQTFAKLVHDHHVICLTIFSFLISNEMQIGHTRYKCQKYP